MLSDSPPDRDLRWFNTGITSSFKFIHKLYEFVDKFKKYETKNSNDVDIIEDLKNIINQVSKI